MDEKNIKEYINNILKIISFYLPISRTIINKKDNINNKYDYYVHVYFGQEKDSTKLRKLEIILEEIFKTQNIGFLLKDEKGKWH